MSDTQPATPEAKWAYPVKNVVGDAASGYIVEMHDGQNARAYMPEGAANEQDAIASAVTWFCDLFKGKDKPAAPQGLSDDVAALTARVAALEEGFKNATDMVSHLVDEVDALKQAATAPAATDSADNPAPDSSAAADTGASDPAS